MVLGQGNYNSSDVAGWWQEFRGVKEGETEVDLAAQEDVVKFPAKRADVIIEPGSVLLENRIEKRIG